GVLLGEELNEYAKGIECFRKALELDPKSAFANNYLSSALALHGWNLINSPDPKLRDPKRALEAAREAVDRAPRSSLAWRYLGWVQYRAGDWRASIEALEKSCELWRGTDDAAEWVVLALAHGRLAA